MTEFETQTSIYGVFLDEEKREFVVKKTRIKRGKESAVAAGEEIRGTRLEISSRNGGLVLYQGDKLILRTSPLKDISKKSIGQKLKNLF